jgi:hypothetical protein
VNCSIICIKTHNPFSSSSLFPTGQDDFLEALAIVFIHFCKENAHAGGQAALLIAIHARPYYLSINRDRVFSESEEHSVSFILA